jgi:preprotein translocase subunit Sss1
MFEKAVKSYKKFGVIVSFGPTIESVTQVLNECRKKTNQEFEAVIKLAEGAFEAAARGDDEEHNRIIVNTIKQFPEDIEAVVLSQMSQMRALPLLKDYHLPVLSSPPISLGVLAEKIAAMRK